MLYEGQKEFMFDDMGYRIEVEDDGYRRHTFCKQRLEDILMFKEMRHDNHLFQFHIEKTHHFK